MNADKMSTDAGEAITRVILADDYHPYLYPIPSSYVPNIMASEDEQWATLASIDIHRRHEADTPLRAWRDAVAVLSGLPDDYFQLERTGGHALDLGFSPAEIRRFVFYLA